MLNCLLGSTSIKSKSIEAARPDVWAVAKPYRRSFHHMEYTTKIVSVGLRRLRKVKQRVCVSAGQSTWMILDNSNSTRTLADLQMGHDRECSHMNGVETSYRVYS